MTWKTMYNDATSMTYFARVRDDTLDLTDETGEASLWWAESISRPSWCSRNVNPPWRFEILEPKFPAPESSSAYFFSTRPRPPSFWPPRADSSTFVPPFRALGSVDVLSSCPVSTFSSKHVENSLSLARVEHVAINPTGSSGALSKADGGGENEGLSEQGQNFSNTRGAHHL